MSIARKVFCVAASFALPIIVLGYLVVRNIDEHIAFAQLELAGLAYQRPLCILLRDLQEHQRLERRCPEGEDCSERISGLRDSITGTLAALRSVDLRYGVMLQFTGEGLAKRGRQLATVENLRHGWEQLASAQAGGKATAPERDPRYDRLADSIQTMLTHVNDSSNLILDPELDTYHLITAASVLLPRTQDRLAQVIAAGRDALARRSIPPAQRMALATQATFLEQADRDQIKSHLDTALSENKNQFHGVLDSFQKDVPIAYAGYAEAADAFIARTRRLADGAVPLPGIDDYIAAGVRAREASFRLWEASTAELGILIQARIAYYVRRKVTALLLSGLTLLLACILAYRIATSLIHPLDKLSRLLTPGADLLDGSVQKLTAFTQDETQDLVSMRIICDELDEHAVNMRKTAKELAVIVDGRGVLIRYDASSPEKKSGHPEDHP
ncbi:MAG: hypothetical protein A2X36_09465 [Elusimicrobia bacterium GWA2_69_24]|nr:MAG: hypothetical protein A2X36_09465 [Elusimicrobia bacterium GWA2_69_24]HBL18678.1 hypothetical protein [Elusimicrobiota bacterium]